ncbi:MAG: Ig-like domain-containing domain [Sphingobacteriaceae bacterium]|nr:Ig-like domain-containing domain [Sphingobacteriaceae bacterium]
MRLARFGGLLAVLLFLWGCANVVPPTGGERDALPPELMRAVPENRSLFFNKRQIRLDFNEYVKLQNPSNIQFTPALEGKPNFDVRFGTLYIDLGPDSLRANTTYTINFGDALTDLNEGNKLVNFRYVFSTGSYLDSLQVSGMVLSAEKREPLEGVLVALYPQDYGDSAIFLKKPFYFTKTNKTGRFSLENLKSGNYFVWVFKDEDNNLKYSKTEEAAFAEQMLVLDTLSADSLRFLLIKDLKANLKLQERRSPEPGAAKFVFSSAPDSLEIGLLDSNTGETVVERMQDSVFFYHRLTTADSLFFRLAYAGRVDTIRINQRKQLPLAMSQLRLLKNNQPSVLEPIKLTANRPILAVFDTALVSWSYDTLSAVKIPFSWKILGTQLEITPELLQNKRYEIFIAQGALQDWFGAAIDSFRFAFSSVSPDAFGDLVVEGLDSLPVGITHIDLLSEAYELIQRVKLPDDNKLTFQKLRPLSYRIRFFSDVNGNGQLDLGSIANRIQPEPLWYLRETAKLRANWEVSINAAQLLQR